MNYPPKPATAQHFIRFTTPFSSTFIKSLIRASYPLFASSKYLAGKYPLFTPFAKVYTNIDVPVVSK